MKITFPKFSCCKQCERNILKIAQDKNRQILVCMELENTSSNFNKINDVLLLLLLQKSRLKFNQL